MQLPLSCDKSTTLYAQFAKLQYTNSPSHKFFSHSQVQLGFLSVGSKQSTLMRLPANNNQQYIPLSLSLFLYE